MLPLPTLCQDLQPVTFLPQWTPQAQFAGYYVAIRKGFYQKRGIDLQLLAGGPDNPPADMLVSRKTDFTTLFLSDAIKLRSRGFDLVNVAQIGQKSGFMLVARKSSGILSPKDLNGKRVSLWSDFKLQPLAFFQKHQIQVTIVPQTYTINLFLQGGVDAACAMWYNEYHTLLNSGVNADELTTFFFDQHDLNFPEDGIYCLHETLKKDDRICRNVVLASLEGWRYAFDHPAEAIDIVMTYVQEAHVGTNRVHQRWMLDRIRDISVTGDGNTPMGTLSSDGYQTVASKLKSGGMIDEVPKFNEFYFPCLDDSR
ncbi:MAG: ABC transporter substrate-binding protein [Deltaproteobacteria bacterium]|nr:ABC transporter substrate-binding protein [Deltaproteobacteria bacterium]